MSAGALEHRVQMIVGRAVVTGVDDARQLQELQVELLADEAQDGVEHFQPYGFAAHPHPGAEGVMLAAGGTRSHGLLIAVGDRRYRMKGMAQGEVALFDDLGQSIVLTRGGIEITSANGVTINTDGPMTVDAESFTVTADSISLASDDVAVGNGASLFAARNTDAVSSSAIVGGSSKVKIA